VKYLSMDIETTGLRRERDQILEVAAVLADTRSREPLEKLPAFRARLYYDEVVGQPFALHLNAKIILDMDRRPNHLNFVHPDNLASRLAQFVDDQKGWDAKGKVTLAGKNAGTFDLPFLQRLEHWDRWMKVHHRVIDPAMYYWHPESDEMLPTTGECIARAGISWEESRLHSAYDDALLVVELVRRGPAYLHQHMDSYARDLAALAEGL
jgi:oligoribonuclease